MSKTIFLHVGTHKTGSTSIQSFLHSKKLNLATHGYAVYESIYNRPNHIDLYLATMRYERDSLGKLKSAETFDETYTNRVCNNINRILFETPQCKLIGSTEGLSLLRHCDEFRRLGRLLRSHENKIEVIVYLRDKTSFLRSYEAQIRKGKDRFPSSDRASSLYVGEDSWLVDYQQLIAAYRRELDCRLSVVNYDHEMFQHGSVLPSFIGWLGIPLSEFPDWPKFKLNMTSI